MKDTVHNNIVRIIMIPAIIILLLTIFVSKCSAQSINIIGGANLIPDKFLFDGNQLSNSPRPFVNFGIGYTNRWGGTISVTYTFDVKMVTVQTSIPIIWFNKKDKNDRINSRATE